MTAPCRPPQASRAPAARCAGWFASASAKAELDHDSPSARKASTAACSSSTGRASTTTSRARRGTARNPRFVALTPASGRSIRRSRPIFDPQPRAMRFVGELRAETRARAARPAARPRATPRPARVRARTTPDALRARPRCARRARHGGTHPRRTPSTPAALRPPRAGEVRSSPRAISRAAGVPKTAQRAFDFRRQRRDAGLARGARRPGRAQPRAAPVRRRRMAIPATTSSWTALDAGGRTVRVERGERMLGLIEPPDQTAGAGPRDSARARRSPGRRALRASPAPRRAPSQAKSKSRETSAISASATTQRARATASLGPKARAARRSSAFARAKIAELRHGDAAKRERGRVVAQGDPLQRAERITRRQCTRRGRDQRVHRNPVTLVTPTTLDARF